MPTKFPRKKCTLCYRKQVSWKMPCHYSAKSGNTIFFCWECSKIIFEKLSTFDLNNEPNKYHLLMRAFKREDLMPKKRVVMGEYGEPLK